MAYLVLDEREFAGLTGKPEESRQQTAVEGLFGVYERWLDSNIELGQSAIFMSAAHMKYLGNVPPGHELDLEEMFEVAQSMLEHICFEKADVEKFPAGATAWNTHESYPFTGLFVSALMAKLGRGYYDLGLADDMNYLGFGLDQTAIIADVFGDYAGAYQDEVQFSNSMRALPCKGVLLIAREFGDNAAVAAHDVYIHSGSFGKGTGMKAHRILVQGGVFKGLVGDDAYTSSDSDSNVTWCVRG